MYRKSECIKNGFCIFVNFFVAVVGEKKSSKKK